jgi:anti-sigma regulatory factor (Ser/Thr protein kinase)
MGNLQSPPLLELWLPADSEAVPEARRTAMKACLAVGLDDEDCFSLDLALGEALANAVVHGAPAASRPAGHERHVCISLWSFQDQLIIQVSDHGQGFEPPLPPYPMPPAAQGDVHGRGLPLMETLTDAMMVCRGDVHSGGASVFLVKKMRGLTAV